ncbi:short-chain dehydrogenase/reductase 2b-like [Chenopodium quinoa]|uniref:short-chain dehydrogenase/reductase 2b-like n=1 Tax=Chenopodium quinoa TaxID=63459 RepID=UPI000B778BE4|nr:short-chain dehydrogenase/reductase 2b-like [Chenopodium quinoa]
MELRQDPSSSTRWWGKETRAIVTGGNRGIGLAIVKRLAELGVTVILTARDAKKGKEALELLRNEGLGDFIHFSVLDVSDPHSISAFATWFNHNFGVFDILVNNAAVSFNGLYENSVKHAEIVIKTNFYGPKLLIEALLPFFRCSSTHKSRILNFSSRLGLIHTVKNKNIRAILEDEENLSEEKIDGVIKLFLEQVKEGKWENEGWPKEWTDYAVSKLALNAYSRILARRLRDSNISVNCFCPGFTQTGMTGGKGSRTADIAANIGAQLALLPPQSLQTGKFSMGQSFFLHSRF